MASKGDQATASQEGAGRAASLGGPMLAVGAFVAGAALTLVARRLVGARQEPGRALEAGAREERDVGDGGSQDDLATVLRRAALDVAVAATGRAAERLRPEEAEGVASSSR